MLLSADAQVLLLVLAGSVLVGAAGHWLFRRTGVTDVLVLLGVGVAAGLVLPGVADTVLARAFALLAPAGLLLVLFEGGLSLGWEDLRRVGTRALRATLTIWLLTATALWLVGAFLLALPPVVALLLACALAGPGVTALLPLLPEVTPRGDLRTFLTVETTMGSLLNATSVTAVVAVLLLDASPAAGAGLVAGGLLVGASMGLLAGLAWTRALHLLDARDHGYALTLGALMLAAVATDVLGGNGFLMALAFGLVVGNATSLGHGGGLRGLSTLTTAHRRGQTEIIFVFRSAYFVFAGLAVAPFVLDAALAWGGLALAVVILVVRAVVVVSSSSHAPDDALLLVALMPRGLTTAVVASAPAALGVAGASLILPYAFFVMIGAHVVTSAGVVASRRRRARRVTAATGSIAGMAAVRKG